MPSKLDILNKYGKKNDVNTGLLSKVFDIERARLHSGESEKRLRQDEILALLRKWVGDKEEMNES